MWRRPQSCSVLGDWNSHGGNRARRTLLLLLAVLHHAGAVVLELVVAPAVGLFTPTMRFVSFTLTPPRAKTTHDILERGLCRSGKPAGRNLQEPLQNCHARAEAVE